MKNPILKRLRALLLSGTILGSSFSCNTWLQDSKRFPFPAKKPDTGRQYPEREKRLSTLFSECVQTDYASEKVPVDTKILWRNMRSLKASNTLTGVALADFSVKEDIFYCSTDIAPTTAGAWSGSDGTIYIARHDLQNEGFTLLTQIHETVHGIQEKNGVMEEDMSWSIYQFQRSQLAIEAAAMSSEYVVALDLLDTGSTLAWKSAVRQSPAQSKIMMQTYQESIKNGAPYAKALADGGKAVFYGQFKRQQWLDFYNNQTLQYYIDLLIEGQLRKPRGHEYTLEAAKKTGIISPQFNFTANLDQIPDNLFGANIFMKHAFEYVELERLASHYGRKHPDYLKTLKKLEEQENPYLGIDLQSVKNNKLLNTMPILNLMEIYAELQRVSKATQKPESRPRISR